MDEFVTLLEQPTRANAVTAISKNLNRLKFDNFLAGRIARERAGDLAQDLSNTARLNLKRVVARALREDMPRRELERRIADIVGLDRRQAIAIEGRRQALIDQGVGRGEARRIVREQARQFRQVRAARIARTEMQQAINDARRVEWQNKYANNPLGYQREWRVNLTSDDRICPICRPMHGKRTTVISGVYSTSAGIVPGPPAHPNCRCYEVIRKVR